MSSVSVPLFHYRLSLCPLSIYLCALHVYAFDVYGCYIYTIGRLPWYFGKMNTINSVRKISAHAKIFCICVFQANKRLSGDATEDPGHPKIQYPSSKACPRCRNPKGLYNEEEVRRSKLGVWTFKIFGGFLYSAASEDKILCYELRED